ncbi:hypothetical protein YC2023_060412 [Brassica napus]
MVILVGPDPPDPLYSQESARSALCCIKPVAWLRRVGMSSKRFHCKSGGKLPIFHLRRILGPSRDSCGGDIFLDELSERNRGDVLVLCVSSTRFPVCQAGSVVDILVPVVFASSRVDSFSF